MNLALTFLGNNPEENLYKSLSDKLIIIAKGNSKDLATQNKAITCLANLTQFDQDLLSEYLVWVAKNLESIEDKGNINSLLGLFQKVLDVCPTSYPPVMKSVYHFLDMK